MASLTRLPRPGQESLSLGVPRLRRPQSQGAPEGVGSLSTGDPFLLRPVSNQRSRRNN